MKICSLKLKGVIKIKAMIKKLYARVRPVCFRTRKQDGQSTIEYALVLVIAGIISAILVAVGKPMIVDLISKVFGKIASMV